LAEFGTRSVITHAIMAVTFIDAIVSGLFVEGQVGLVSFVAFLTAITGFLIAAGSYYDETE